MLYEMIMFNKKLINSLNKVAVLLGRDKYQLDKDLAISDLFGIIFKHIVCYFRFLIIKPFLGSSHSVSFIGRSVQIISKRKLIIGKSFFIGNFCKLNLLCRNKVIIGDNFVFKDSSVIDCAGVYTNIGSGLIIGNNVGISEGCFIQVRGNVTIGDDVIIGPGAKIFSENHNYSDANLPTRLQEVTRSEVIIEPNTWIGANAVVLAGVKIGANSIVAAGCVVNKSFPKNSIIGGVPSRLLGQRS